MNSLRFVQLLKHPILHHIIRIFIFSLLLLPQEKISYIQRYSIIEIIVKAIIFVLPCYIIARKAIGSSFEIKVDPWKITLCFTPFLLPICFYFAQPWLIIAAYILSMPLCILIYLLIFRINWNYFFFLKISILIFLWSSFIIRLHFPEPYYDVWQLYDLGINLKEHFSYQTDYIRNAQYNTGYSSSFPFLYPIMLIVTDILTNLGLRSYILLNYAACFLVIVVIRAVSLLHGQGHKWGITAWIILLLPEMYQEVNGGGTTPFTLLLMLCLVWFLSLTQTQRGLTKPAENRSRESLIFGFILGLGCMIRFDFLAFSFLALASWSIYHIISANWKAPLFAILAYSLCLLPWSIYSFIHFNHPYIMDNSRRLIYLHDTLMSTFYPVNSEEPTLFTHTALWFHTKIDLILTMLKEFIIFILIVPSTLLMVISALYQNRRRTQSMSIFTRSCICLIICSSVFLPILFLTGFLENERYYLPFLALLILISSLYITFPSIKISKKLRNVSFILFTAGFFALLCSNSVYSFLPERIKKLIYDIKNSNANYLHLEKLTDQERTIKNFIHSDSQNKGRLLCPAYGTPSFFLPRFALSSDIITVRDYSAEDEHLTQYLQEKVLFFNIDYVYAHEPHVQHLKKSPQEQGFYLESTPVENLYLIKYQYSKKEQSD